MKTTKKTKLKQLQFTFLPHISIKDDLKIGEVILWSFYKKKDEYIKNQLIKSQIEQYLKRYVDNLGKHDPLKNITIVSYKFTNNFKPLTKIQARKIRDIVTILCFSTIIKNNNWLAFSSDDFQLVRQNFIPGDDGITPSSGSFITRKVGGLKIEEVLFITPFYVSQGWDINYDEKILKGLEKLYKDKKSKEFYKRVINSLEWVLYAYTNVDNFNYLSRIVMMATAFEILLNGFRDRFEFMKKIKQLTCNSYDTKKMKSTREIYYKNKRQRKSFSFKEWWAYEFYDLRSKIVHGEQIRSNYLKNRKGKEYFLLSVKFFLECLKKLLSQHNYYDYDYEDRILWAGIYQEI
jgi:hypothetical protein